MSGRAPRPGVQIITGNAPRTVGRWQSAGNSVGDDWHGQVDGAT
ncbi:hypothetical protein ACE0DR_20590 [Azotobacter sp. CWF10]